MSLPQPRACSLQLVDDVVAERQNGVNADFFNGIHVEWRNRVQAYINAGGSPEIVPSWPAIEDRAGTFQNLYKSPSEGSAQGIVLAELRAHGLVLCPACGEAGAPNTLDHYLPKTSYPHFSVTPLNLFPMCDACQTNKGTKTGSAAEPRFFLHPYFDTFAANQLFQLTVDPPYDAPTFSLSVTPGLRPNQASVVDSHLRELKIAERFSHFFRNQHRLTLRLVFDMRVSGQDVVQGLALFRSMAERKGANFWEHIYYQGVLTNDALVDYLCNDELPDLL